MSLELTRRYPQKRAFITGAASGFGLALAETLAAEAWTIGLTDLREEVLAPAAARIEELGGKAQTYAFDVSDRVAFQAALAEFAQSNGGFDVIINNAGVAGGGPMGDFSLDDWDWLIDINLKGVVYGCHFAVPYLKQQGAGHIINVASAAGFIPVPEMPAYCTVKAGVRMLSEVLYNELAPFGVDVTVAMPTFFRTNLHERTRGPHLERAKFMITSSPHSAEEVARTLLEHAGRRAPRMIYGNDAKLVWRLMRWMPNRALKLIQQRTARMQKAFEKAEAKQRAKAQTLPEEG